MILLTAATPWESKPLAKRLGLAPSGPRTFRGRVGGLTVALIETGMGSEATTRGLESLGGEAPATVVSAGLAGALQPGMRSGDLVADLRGCALELVDAAKRRAAEAKVTLHLGAIYTAPRVLAEPEEKRLAGVEKRAAAVDLESAAVRAWCERRGASFIGVRAVLDEVGHSLPDGAPADDSPREALRFALGHWTEFPALALLGTRQKRALSALGRFLDLFLLDLEDHARVA